MLYIHRNMRRTLESKNHPQHIIHNVFPFSFLFLLSLFFDPSIPSSHINIFIYTFAQIAQRKPVSQANEKHE